jgi:hypothetical protein
MAGALTTMFGAGLENYDRSKQSEQQRLAGTQMDQYLREQQFLRAQGSQ